jgi:hypothetical protein
VTVEGCAGVVGRGLDNHETCGALHSDLRLVNLAMLREQGCPQLGARIVQERTQPSSYQPHPVEPGALAGPGVSAGSALCVASRSSRSRTRPIPTPPWTDRTARFFSD